MSIYTKACLILVFMLVATDIGLLIAGFPPTESGLPQVIWLAVASIHWRIDRLDRGGVHMQVLAHAQLRATERQTDALRGRR